MENKENGIVSEKSFESNTRDVIVAYLIDRRSALCRELASVERQLANLGKPIKNPKIKDAQPRPTDERKRDNNP